MAKAGAKSSDKQPPRIAIVVAFARNGVIGAENKLLWRLKSDLRRFRQLTIGKPVIMGRKTFQSIGRLLPDRKSIVLTRDRGYSFEGAAICHTLDEAVEIGRRTALALGVEDVMIAGGADIYRQIMPQTDAIFATEVDLEPEGDAFFPSVEPLRFREIRREAHAAGPDDEAAFSFVDYLRRPHSSG
jgi:dihydrofolate reductase